MKLKKYMLFILVIATLCMVGCQKQDIAEQPEEDYIPVSVKQVALDSIEDGVVISGRSLPSKEVIVVPTRPGEVEKLYVSVGSWVDLGQNLFSLDKTILEQQLSQAEAGFNSAYANYQITLDQVESAKSNFERMKALYESGAISRSQYEQAELAASEKPLEAASAALEQARVGYEAAQDAYNDTIIKAPIKGLVSLVNIEEGEIASNTQPALVIIDVNPLVIRLDVTENLINKLIVGESVDVTIPALNKKVSGIIVTVSPAIDSRTMLYPVEVEIKNDEHEIKANMFTEVGIIIDERKDVLVIPSEAVLVKDNQEIVYIVENNCAVMQEITTGLDNGENVEIISGLSKDDTIIVSGQNYVSDGSKVKIVRGDE